MKKILSLLFIILLSFSLISCGNDKEDPVDNKIGDFHTELQNKYLAGDYKNASIYSKGKEELSRPNPINLKWELEGSSYQVIIKEKDDNKELVYNTTNTNLDVYNLKIHTEYEWYVNEIKQGEFKTCDTLRNLYIDGITNCRDIGGYKLNNGYSNQGLLFRTSKLNDDYTGEVLITAKGIEALKQLGIKTELDLRKIEKDDDGIEQGNINSCCVEGVNYISFPMASGGNYLQLNESILKDLFKILGNKDNYPMVFHCSIGTDRTGVVAFLVNALIGVSEEDLYLDYCFSNFGLIYSMRSASTITDYIKKVTSDKNKSLQENVKNYLINLGVSEIDINNVIEIMTK